MNTPWHPVMHKRPLVCGLILASLLWSMVLGSVLWIRSTSPAPLAPRSAPCEQVDHPESPPLGTQELYPEESRDPIAADVEPAGSPLDVFSPHERQLMDPAGSPPFQAWAELQQQDETVRYVWLGLPKSISRKVKDFSPDQVRRFAIAAHAIIHRYHQANEAFWLRWGNGAGDPDEMVQDKSLERARAERNRELEAILTQVIH